MAIDVTAHVLVPQHEIVPEKERKQILETYSASPEDLPKILITDPGLTGLSAKEGDLIKITRSSPTAGEAIFYRIVINE